jgi:thioredoxin 1
MHLICPTGGNFMSVSLLRRAFLIGSLAVIAGVSAVQVVDAQAVFPAKVPFTEAGFKAAQTAGKPILVDVSAPWCPTCKAQAPVIQSLMKKPEFKNFALFEVDFDTQKDALRMFNARQQSTLIVFKGKTETARSTGETGAGAIEILVGTAL